VAISADNLAGILDEVLPVSLRHIPLRIRDTARDLDLEAALAGGIPRDLLRVRYGQLHPDQFTLGLRDFDVTVSGGIDPRLGGAGVRFAYELARRLPGRLVVNEAFHTACLTTSEGVRIDVATARREHYPVPGHLPEVDVGDVTIAADLNRRDFSVNAIAMDLSQEYGRLIDNCGGVGDLNDRLIRVLHAASFFDDPTRIMRAVRYSVRLGFDLEPTTVSQLERAVEDDIIDHLTPERVRYELECIGSEDGWLDMWAALDVFGVTRSISGLMADVSGYWHRADAKALDIAIRNQSELTAAEELEPWLIRTAWVLGVVPPDGLESAGGRIGLFKRQLAWLTASREVLSREVAWLVDDPSPRSVCLHLERYPRQAVLVAMFIFQPRNQEEVAARRLLRRFLEDYSQVRCDLDGRDLLAMGLRPGPLVGKIRDELRYLRMDGAIKNKDDEKRLAAELIERWGAPEDFVPGAAKPGSGDGPADSKEQH